MSRPLEHDMLSVIGLAQSAQIVLTSELRDIASDLNGYHALLAVLHSLEAESEKVLWRYEDAQITGAAL